MAKIIWKGFTEHVIRAPHRPLPPDARPLIVPRRHYWLKAILLAVPVWLPVLASLYLKNSLLQTDLRDRPWIVAGMALAMLLGPLHECLTPGPIPREPRRISACFTNGFFSMWIAEHPSGGSVTS